MLPPMRRGSLIGIRVLGRRGLGGGKFLLTSGVDTLSCLLGEAGSLSSENDSSSLLSLDKLFISILIYIKYLAYKHLI